MEINDNLYIRLYCYKKERMEKEKRKRYKTNGEVRDS